MRKELVAIALTALLAAACAAGPSAHGPASGGAERIAFLSHVGGFWQVFVADLDGSDARQLTHSRSEKSRVSWYPDGRALLVDTQNGELFRVDVETGSEIALPLPVRGMLDAAISPDGRRLAFSLTQSDSPDANEIWVCDLDGKNLRALTNRAGLQHWPAWDAAGGFIYYLSDLGPGVSHEIWRVRVDGTADERLSFGELRHLDVAVSSQGDLAYSGNQAGGYDVWLKRPQAPPSRLTDDAALDAHPSFSPDGSAIVFESSRGGTLNVWRVSASGGPIEPVTRLPAPGARLPVWSPGSAKP